METKRQNLRTADLIKLNDYNFIKNKISSVSLSYNAIKWALLVAHYYNIKVTINSIAQTIKLNCHLFLDN